MEIKVSGTFQVDLIPETLAIDHGTSLEAGRMVIDKTFEGALEGHSNGEMMSILTGAKNAGGYVAVEIFEGTLEGIPGSFAMQHYGKFDSSGQSLTLEIIPGTGEGELTGIRGSMDIRVENEQHIYELQVEV
ncbi:MAG: hypothetical protein Salg2KO_00160 [Salibacteraceae bacterium]